MRARSSLRAACSMAIASRSCTGQEPRGSGSGKAEAQFLTGSPPPTPHRQAHS